MAPVFLKTKATRKNNNKIGEKTRSDNNEKRLIKIVLALLALNLLLLTT